MHPAAKRWATVGAALLVLGVLVLTFGPDMFAWASAGAGANAEAGLWVLSLLLNVVREVFLPVGAALLGAAAVIQALSPAPGRRDVAAGASTTGASEAP